MRWPPLLLALVRGLASMRLTVALLVLAIVLVFFGTLDQVRIGIREAQKLYFESFLAVWHYPADWPMGGFFKWIPLPMPGGYVIGPLLAFNLLAAHMRHFRPRWGILGISLIHLGVVLLLVGQLVTNLFQQEDYMWLDEGETANFVRSFHHDELYLTRRTEDGKMGVYSFPYEDLREGLVIDPPQFPFQLRVKEVFVNAELKPEEPGGFGQTYGVNRGIGAQFQLAVRQIPSFRSDDQRDVRTAVVEVLEVGRPAGTWLVSNVFEERFPEQTFRMGGSEYAIGLRFRKTYLPFSMTLLEFTHERYPGTNIPSNFSSRVRVEHPGRDHVEEVSIFMNHPLRFEGFTFFQASFARQDTASMFQVVRNPGWLLPYIACSLVSIGLLYQFAWVGFRNLRRSRK